MNKNDIDYRVYLCTDRGVLAKAAGKSADSVGSEDLYKAVCLAVAGGVGIVQVREKDAAAKDFLDIVMRLKDIGVPVIVNDRVDIAMLADADGVHLGQKDLPADRVRELIGPEKIIGVSAATVEEAITAEKAGADYIGCGALFPTATKEETRPVSRDLLKEICTSVDIPVVGIGGINRDNVMKLAGTGIAGVAVVSAVMGAEDIKKAAADMYEAGGLL